VLPADGEKNITSKFERWSGWSSDDAFLIFGFRNRGMFRPVLRELNKHPMWRLSLAGYGLRFRGVASLFGGSLGRCETAAVAARSGAMSRCWDTFEVRATIAKCPCTRDFFRSCISFFFFLMRMLEISVRYYCNSTVWRLLTFSCSISAREIVTWN